MIVGVFVLPHRAHFLICLPAWIVHISSNDDGAEMTADLFLWGTASGQAIVVRGPSLYNVPL